MGFTGSQGVGYAGSAGAIGFTGSQGVGFTGSSGAFAAIGYTGSAGAIGYAGSTGFTGSQGTPGGAAAIGYTGSQGVIGFTGSTGTIGSQGGVGFTGSQGAGFTGSQGVIGFTGSSGAFAAIGYTGSQGTAGVGYTGSQGVGFTGSSGYTGSQGTAGVGGTIAWSITSSGSSDYVFSGPGIISGNTNDPVLYVHRGGTYTFENLATSHPLEIRLSSGGAAYTSGVSGSQTGTQTFIVPMNAPATLYYQCTIHSGMGNVIKVVNVASDYDQSDFQVKSLGVGTAASGTTGEIRATNEITAYYSDARLKNFISTIPDALSKVMQLHGYYFTENDVAKSLGYDNPHVQVGVSAQEVQRVLPEIVVPAPIDDMYLTVKYEKIVPLLIETIKELNGKVSELTKIISKE